MWPVRRDSLAGPIYMHIEVSKGPIIGIHVCMVQIPLASFPDPRTRILVGYSRSSLVDPLTNDESGVSPVACLKTPFE